MSILAITAALGLIGPASAAPVKPEFEVQVWPGGEPGGVALLTGVAVGPEVSLPVTVSVPVPEGFELVWVGENLGGDVSADPTRPYVEKTGPDGRWVEFSLRTARAGQVECVMSPLVTKDGKTTAALEWRQSVPASITGFSVRLPAGADDPSIVPAPVGSPDANETGDTLYTLPSRQLVVGERMKLSIAYATAAATTSGDADSSTAILGVLLAALVLATAALALVLVRRRGGATEGGRTD